MTYTLRINVIRALHQETDGLSKMGHVWVFLSDGVSQEFSYGFYPNNPSNFPGMFYGPVENGRNLTP